jgi:iron-sulfur cluster repair protein YtfE (RIC family)
MVIDFTDPSMRIDHDHTHFDVLFEDMTALMREALSADGDEQLLSDARSIWSRIHEEVQRHFWKEERRIFAVLAPLFPDIQGQVDQLQHQHQLMRREFLQLGQWLKGTLEELSAIRETLDRRWTALLELWHDHSSREWELIGRVMERMARDEPPPPAPPA